MLRHPFSDEISLNFDPEEIGIEEKDGAIVEPRIEDFEGPVPESAKDICVTCSS